MEKKSPNGKFPLYLAIVNNYSATVRLLLKRGAHITERTNKNMTALHVACMNELPDVTALLLQYGADMNARDREGKTPFELLSNSPSSEATARIIIREAVRREALGQPLCNGYIKVVLSRHHYSRFDKECREEVKRMKNASVDVDGSAISFFQIFLRNEEKLAGLVRNEQIVREFESSGYVASFSIYAVDLVAKIQMAKRRAKFLIRIENCLADVVGDILPAPIVQKVATYVTYDQENELQ